jgi:hypothetical protein
VIRKKSDDTCVNPKIKHRIQKVCVKFLILNLEAFNFRYNISFIDPPLGGFGEILPSVMIFPSGQSPSGNIITSCNISPNPPRSRSINDNYPMRIDRLYTSCFIVRACNNASLIFILALIGKGFLRSRQVQLNLSLFYPCYRANKYSSVFVYRRIGL